MVNIVAKYVNNILIGYYGSYENRTVFLDLSMLKFYPNSNTSPSIVSWEGFNEDDKFKENIYNYKENIIDLPIDEIKKLIEPYLTREFKYGKIKREDVQKKLE